MGVGHDGQERLARKKHLGWLCGKNMKKIRIVQDVDELSGKNKRVLVGCEWGRLDLRSRRYDNGTSFSQRRSPLVFDRLLCGPATRRRQQGAEGIKELVVLGGGFPQPMISESLELGVESIPGDQVWTVRPLLDVEEEQDGVFEEGVVRCRVSAGSELVEDAVHDDRSRDQTRQTCYCHHIA